MPVEPDVAARLEQLGEALKKRRKQLGVTAAHAAEAAGMSRTTLHRIERGTPSVTMSAYLSAIAVLGLELKLVDPTEPKSTALPERIDVSLYPMLARLAWQRDVSGGLTPEEAFASYERNWRHVDPDALSPRERELIERLAEAFGGRSPLV